MVLFTNRALVREPVAKLKVPSVYVSESTNTADVRDPLAMESTPSVNVFNVNAKPDSEPPTIDPTPSVMVADRMYDMVVSEPLCIDPTLSVMVSAFNAVDRIRSNRVTAPIAVVVVRRAKRASFLVEYCLFSDSRMLGSPMYDLFEENFVPSSLMSSILRPD